MDVFLVSLGLFLIFLVVLLAPFLNRRIEHNLEAFLLVMGLAAATVSSVWSLKLVEEALTHPIYITLAVLVAGLLFFSARKHVDRVVVYLSTRLSVRLLALLVVVVLGLLSSVISAIIAALILVEIVTLLRLDRRTEVNLTVIACFSIGLGAALTPLGEPLSTIAIGKLKGPPYYADFFYLIALLGAYIIPGVLALGVGSLFLLGRIQGVGEGLRDIEKPQGLREVFIRALRVYIFVMALTILGEGFKPIIDWYFVKIPGEVLFWANTTSAILDNATLTAAEIGPALSLPQIKSALMALIVAGGMLIPGNIPNIISAHRLGIRSREWARLGLPLGAVLMVLYFLALYLPVWLGA